MQQMKRFRMIRRLRGGMAAASLSLFAGLGSGCVHPVERIYDAMPMNGYQIYSGRVASHVIGFLPSTELCEYRGRIIAIVPGSEFSATIDKIVDFKTAAGDSYDIATSTGSLTYRVNSGRPRTVRGGQLPIPEGFAFAADIWRKMGFQVLDRGNVKAVLDEQDLQIVTRSDATRIGQLLGADVLSIVSWRVEPIVYFESASDGAWAVLVNARIRAVETIIDVATGLHLGSSFGRSTTFGACGFERIEAMHTGQHVRFRVQHKSGQWFAAQDLNFDSDAQTRQDEDYILAKWRRVCAGS